MNIKNSNVTINIENLDRSIAFYESIGFDLKERWGDHYAQLTAPGIVIGLHPSTAPERPKNSGIVSIGFTTEPFDEVKTELVKLGISISERKEEGGDFIHFKDPDGTSLYFIRPRW